MHLVIFGAEKRLIDRLRELVKDRSGISVFVGDGPAATRGCKLDALFLTAMQGERFGINPVIAPGVCTIQTNSAPMVAEGLPRYVISCGTRPEPDWIEKTLTALYKSLLRFNADHPSDPIERVGTIPANLGITAETADDVMRILERQWPSRR